MKENLFFLVLMSLPVMSWASSVNVRLDFHFGSGLSHVWKKDFPILKGIAEIHSKIPHARVYVTGHTDSAGRDAVNQELSEARAKTVRDHLINYGIDEGLISSRGYGERAPIGDNATKEGMTLNRRVVVTFYGIKSDEAKYLANVVSGNQMYKEIVEENKAVEQDVASLSNNVKTQVEKKIYQMIGDVRPEETDANPVDMATLSESEKEKYEMKTLVGAEKSVLDVRKEEYEANTNGTYYQNNPVPYIVKEEFEAKYFLGGAPDNQLAEESEAGENDVMSSDREVVVDTESAVSAETTAEQSAMMTTQETVTNEKERDRKRKMRIYGKAYIGPDWSSKYYGDDIGYEHGKISYLSFGLHLGARLSKRLFLDGYGYYLPTEVKGEPATINFQNGNTYSYENNLYGARLGYAWRGNSSYRLSFLGGLVSHIIGGLDRTGANTYSFEKYNHLGLSLGVKFEKKLVKGWVLDTDLAYLFPLDVSGLQDYSGKLWYRGSIEVKKQISKKMALSLAYQAVYHETEMTFNSGSTSTPEFLIQTAMLGVGWKF